MSSPGRERADISRRILVLAPTGVDAGAVANVLRDGGFTAHLCPTMATLTGEFSDRQSEGAGAAIIAQEALLTSDGAAHRLLSQSLAEQAEWSDLPVILLASGTAGEDGAWRIARALDPVGNITILERPLRRTTLLNAVAVALRARTRQYELRDALGVLDLQREGLSNQLVARTTELTESMSRLVAAERLASLGTLAAGLGHDLANLTLPIRLRLDTLSQHVESEEAKSDLVAIRQALTHLGHLSAGMRLMAMDPGREGASTAATDLEEWTAETKPMLAAALPRTVRLECDIAPGLSTNVPRHRLAQAVFNLVQNAGEAMATQDEGCVRVTADACAGDTGKGMVRVCVSDNGPGMAPGVLARCFEPYFTTKGRSIATGMGLGMVKGVVEAAGGTVTAHSTPGAGTTFTLLVPSARRPERPGKVSGPVRVGAVTLADKRVASLVCMLLEQLDIQVVRHGTRGAPAAELWVLDDADRSMLTEYLAPDPRRRVLVLGGSRATGAAGAHAGHEFDERVVVLSRSPTARELKQVLASLRDATQRAGCGA